MVRAPGTLTSGNITNVTLNVPLLCAAGGVALAVVAEHLASAALTAVTAEHPASSVLVFVSFLSGTSFVIVLITLAYALFELIRQGLLARQQPTLAPGVYRSASLAAFFLGLISVAVSDTNPLGLQFAAMGFCVLALVIFLALVLRGPTDTVSQEPAYDPEQAGLYPPDSFPRSGSLPSLYGPEGVATPAVPRKSRIDPSTLPPVFESDPLYSLPHPRRARFFSVVKGNDIPVASDDACVISDDETYFALCDGASGSSLPRPWATLLGQQWLKQPFQEIDAATLSSWLQEPRERWHTWVQETWRWKIDERNQLIGHKPLSPDVFRRTLQTGASATFLGLILHRESRTWHAVAIGDTCLFHLRPDKSGVWQARSFPLEKSTQFSDRPPLLPSNGNNVATLIPYVHYGKEHYRRGDVLMMATDALAQWLLSQIEQQQSDWTILPSLTDQRRFAELVEKERQSGHIVDDDTTLVVIPV